ncbi:MAG: SpoIIE family protein phosphatase [Planctomycetes bacterium]|nr:SpoIIE family protein phosphatase [Planctomycetota bacterium]
MAADSERAAWVLALASELAAAQDFNDFHAALGEFVERVAPASGWSLLLRDADRDSFRVQRSSTGAADTVELGPELEVFWAGGPEPEPGALATLGGTRRSVAFAARLEYQGDPYGLFLVHSNDLASGLGDETRRILAAASRIVAARYVTIDLYQQAAGQARESAERLLCVRRLGTELSGGLVVEELVPKIVYAATEVTKAPVGTVVLKKGDRFETLTEFGIPFQVVADLRMAGGEKLLVDHVLESGETILVRDPASDGRVDFSRVTSHQVENLLAVPLATDQRKLGVLLVANSASRPLFPHEELGLVDNVAGVASQAIENAMVHEEGAQLRLAHKIQSSLLPATPPSFLGFDLAGWSQACDETGGDYYDFVVVDEDRLGVMVGDVSGHGLGAALYMMTARALLRSFLTTVPGIDAVLARTNNMLAKDMGSDQFMTCFLGLFDQKERKLLFTSAGHDAPFLYRQAEDRFLDLDSTGFPLGLMEDAEFPLGPAVDLASGDVLALGTDGIWEAMNPGDEEYGRERLCEVLRANAGQGAAQIVEAIRCGVLEFCAGRQQRDDWTLCVLKVK